MFFSSFPDPPENERTPDTPESSQMQPLYHSVVPVRKWLKELKTKRLLETTPAAEM